MKTQNHRSTLKVILLLLISITFSGFTEAQNNLNGPNPVVTGNTETYIYNDGSLYGLPGWDITNGTLISSSETGSKYTAVIEWGSVGTGSVSFLKKTTVKETLNVTINQPPPTVVTDLNYVHNTTPRIETTNIGTLGNAEKIESITYFDGLGRARQSIGIRAGGGSEDIITHIAYDEFGRQVKDYLPYSSSSNIGTYRTDALDATNTYYDYSSYNEDFPGMTVATINPYSEKAFDNSPLNRVLQQAAPGKDWQLGNNHEIDMNYLTNIANEVRYYYVTLLKDNVNGVVTYKPTLHINTHPSEKIYYDPNDLYKTVTKDENHDGSNAKEHTTEEFKNKQGQVILKRTYGSSVVNGTLQTNVAHDTYYVYDDFGNLTFVLPPKSEPHADQPDGTELSELCYQYKYDDRNRLVEKKIPGKGWEYIVYNKLDQPIMTQDTELKTDGKWLVTKYDVFGRVAYTAIKETGTNPEIERVSLQGTFDNDPSSVPQFESKVTSGTGYLNTYYTSVARPGTVDEILTINYYDNYSFDLVSGFSENAYGIWPTTNPKGLATGSKVKVLDTNDWITTVSYYDEKSRPIYIYSHNNYLNTTDKVKSQLTFDGRATETTTTHFKTGKKTITIIDKYTYDHANRLTDHTQKVNNAALDEVIASNTYDDLGQLESKTVGGKTNQSGLQKIHYEYNVRGWLKRINDPNNLGSDLFGFKINYNTEDNGGTKLYNGNITEIEWKTKTDSQLRWYKYEYDALNRITNGTANNSNYDLSSVAYDKNGNITNLTRKGHVNEAASVFGTMDDLFYTYEAKSNRLKKVFDNKNTDFGFKDGANINIEYTYDDNGNMISDANKGITSISYNHLNLPTNVDFTSGDITYIYDATGVKQKKIVSTGTTTEYAGNYIYENNTLKMFSHPEGYTEKRGKYYGYTYQYKDHLGNIRLTYADSDGNGSINSTTEIIEENNYYPFGLKHKGYNDIVSANVNSQASKYKYNGKEFNDELGLDWYDYGARNYDASLGRWMNIDPLASKYNEYTPYNYVINNPILMTDPDGKDPIDPRTGKPFKLDLWTDGIVSYDKTKNNLDPALLKKATPTNILGFSTPRYIDRLDGKSWQDDPDSSFDKTSDGAREGIAKILGIEAYTDDQPFTAPHDSWWRVAAESGTYVFENSSFAESQFLQIDTEEYNIISVEDNMISQITNLTLNENDQFDISSVTTFGVEKGEVKTRMVKTGLFGLGKKKVQKYRTLTVTETVQNYTNNVANGDPTSKTYTRTEIIE